VLLALAVETGALAWWEGPESGANDYQAAAQGELPGVTLAEVSTACYEAFHDHHIGSGNNAKGAMQGSLIAIQTPLRLRIDRPRK
jgi:hypothetical protein